MQKLYGVVRAESCKVADDDFNTPSGPVYSTLEEARKEAARIAITSRGGCVIFESIELVEVDALPSAKITPIE